MNYFNTIFTSFFVLIGVTLALIPEPGFHSQLQSEINPNGITKVDKYPFIPPQGASALVIILPNIPEDFSYYTLDGTTANCDYEYNSTVPDSVGTEQNPIHFSNNCVSFKPVTFLVECTVTQNEKGQDNFIYVIFNQTGSFFWAYGETKAVFVPKDLKYPSNVPVGSPPSTTIYPNIPFTDQDSNTKEDSIILTVCPASTSPPI